MNCNRTRIIIAEALTFNAFLRSILVGSFCLYAFMYVSFFQDGKIPQTPIVIVDICPDSCGLGNQMFRYAAALALAASNARNHTVCIFGLQDNSGSPVHAMSRFDQHVTVLSPWSHLVLDTCPEWVGSFHITPFRYALDTFAPEFMDTFSPPHSTYVPFPDIPRSKSLLVMGCMQSFKYFDSIFSRQPPPFHIKQQQAATLWMHLHRIDTVVHVRRGDKLNDGSPVVPIAFYEQAMRRLPHAARVLVCTDDAAWVRAQTLFENATVYSRDPGFDMALMAAATEAVIIGVGTFAWWGAYLSRAKRVYYYPQMYQGDLLSGYVEADYIPPKWLPVSAVSSAVTSPEENVL
jgi:hypothetical protein